MKKNYASQSRRGLAVVATAPFVSVLGHPVMAVEAKAVPLMVSVILLVPRDVAAATFTWPNEDAENIPLEDKPLSWRKAVFPLDDHLLCDPGCIPVEILVLDQQLQESLLGFRLVFQFVGGADAIVHAH